LSNDQKERFYDQQDLSLGFKIQPPLKGRKGEGLVKKRRIYKQRFGTFECYLEVI
jgi:hypothetical protein